MPLNSTETGRSVKAELSGEVAATSRITDDPAGTTAPFEPITGLVRVATKRSPGRLVDVQIRCWEASAKPEPAPISLEGAAAACVALGVRGTVRVRGGLLIRAGGRDWLVTACDAVV